MNIVRDTIIGILILAVGGGGLYFLGRKPEAPRAETTASDGAPVVTAEVREWDRPFQLELDGEAVTYRVVSVRAEVAGRIIRKTAAARGGSYVSPEDLLFELDPTDYQLEVERLSAQLNQTDADLASVDVDRANAEKMLELAKREVALEERHLQRTQRLRQRDSANQAELEQAEMRKLKAENSQQTLVNQIASLEQQKKSRTAARNLVAAQLKKAEKDLQRCRIVSRIEGRIVEDEVEEGDYLKPGEVLAHISDGSQMEVKTKLRAEELAWVWQQHEVQQSLEALSTGDPLTLPDVKCEVGFLFQGQETIWDGHLSRIEGTGLDRSTRTFPCRVLIEDPRKTRVNDSNGGTAVSPPTLLSGMFVTVRITVESPTPLLELPLEAVRPGGKVWVMRNGKLTVKDVATVHNDDQMALVQSHTGLQKGDRVIISPMAAVIEGMKVTEQGESTETATADSPTATQDSTQQNTAEKAETPADTPADNSKGQS
ncbi:MAG: HlyD family efflux transporter periplasmic adaptor subunit [Planctomycetaceae bacterium]|nr:HlyD family efflux transporter periplasmic adaptor subunit [Planctomycetaceae bacterium]